LFRETELEGETTNTMYDKTTHLEIAKKMGDRKMKYFVGIVILLAIMGAASACQYDTGGHLVKISIVNGTGVPFIGAAVETATMQPAPELISFLSLFGITYAKQPMEYMNSTTDTKGSVIFPMYEIQKYQITALNHTFYLYPQESDYVFSI
jgi:hypothetical protein